MPRRDPWTYKKRKKTSKSSSKTAKNSNTENVAFNSQVSEAEVPPVISPTVLASKLTRIARKQGSPSPCEASEFNAEPPLTTSINSSASESPVNIEIKKEMMKETSKSDEIKSGSTEPSQQQMCSTAVLPAFGLLDSQKALDTEPVKIKKEQSHRFDDTPSTTATESGEEDYIEFLASVKPTKKFNAINPNPTDSTEDIIVLGESIMSKEVEEQNISIFNPVTNTDRVRIKEEIEIEGEKSIKLCDTAPSSPVNVDEEDTLVRSVLFPEETEFFKIRDLSKTDLQVIQTNRNDTSSPIKYTGDVIFSTGIVPVTNETQKQSIFSENCFSSEIKKYLGSREIFKVFDINNCWFVIDAIQQELQNIKFQRISEDEALENLINSIKILDLEVHHELFSKTCESPGAKSDRTNEVSSTSESYQQINSDIFNENSKHCIINPLANNTTNKFTTPLPLTGGIKKNSSFISNNELNNGSDHQIMTNFVQSVSSVQAKTGKNIEAKKLTEMLKNANSRIKENNDIPKNISRKRKSYDEYQRLNNNTNNLLIPENYGMPKSLYPCSQKYQNPISMDQNKKRTRLQEPEIYTVRSRGEDNIRLPTYNNQDASIFISQSIVDLFNLSQEPSFIANNNVLKTVRPTAPLFGPLYDSDSIPEFALQQTEPSTSSGQVRTLQYPQQQDMHASRYPNQSQIDTQNRSLRSVGSQLQQFHQQKVLQNPSKRLNQDEPLTSAESKKKKLDLREYLKRKASTKKDKNPEMALQHNTYETNFTSNLQPTHSEFLKNDTYSLSDSQIYAIKTAINDFQMTAQIAQQNKSAYSIIHNYGNALNSNSNGTNTCSSLQMNSSINLPISNFPSREIVHDNNPRPVPLHLRSSFINDANINSSPILSDPRLTRSSFEKIRGSIPLIPNQSAPTLNISSTVAFIPDGVKSPPYIQHTGFSRAPSTSDLIPAIPEAISINDFNYLNCEVQGSSGFSQVFHNHGDSNKITQRSVSLVPKDLKNNIGRDFIESNYIYLIMIDWSVNWFTQFESIGNSQNPPPILPVELSQVRNTYKDELEYYNTYLKLLLMESWHKLYSSWKEFKNPHATTFQNQIRFEHCAKVTEYETKDYYNKYLIELFATASQAESVPKESGTVLLQFSTPNKEGIIGMLGYVTKVMCRPFFAGTDTDNEAYKALQSNERKVSKYKITVYTVFKSDYIDTKEMVRFNKLTNIRKILQQHDALKKVSSSSLYQVILNPITSQHKISFNIPDGQNDVSEIVKQLCQKILCDDHKVEKSPLLALVNTFRSRCERMAIVSDIINEIHVTKPEAKIIICSKREAELSKIANDLNILRHYSVFLNKDKIPELQKYSLSRLVDKELKSEHSEELDEALKSKRAKEQVLKKCSVILFPLLGCFEEIKTLKEAQNVVCCILDEAHYCTEPESIVPLTLGIKKYVLLGNKDIECEVSNLTESYDFNRSLFNRASL